MPTKLCHCTVTGSSRSSGTHHILGIVLTRQPARADAALPPDRFQILRIVFVRDRARAASTRLHVISTEVFATGETEGTKSGARGSVRAAKNQRLDRRQKRKNKKIKQIVSHLSCQSMEINRPTQLSRLTRCTIESNCLLSTECVHVSNAKISAQTQNSFDLNL